MIRHEYPRYDPQGPNIYFGVLNYGTDENGSKVIELVCPTWTKEKQIVFQSLKSFSPPEVIEVDAESDIEYDWLQSHIGEWVTISFYYPNSSANNPQIFALHGPSPLLKKRGK